MRAAWIDHNEAILFGEAAVRAPSVIGLCRACAVVDCNNDAWGRSEFLRDVDVETSFGGGGAERGDLLERAGGNGAFGNE